MSSTKLTFIFFLFGILFVSDWALICKNCNIDCLSDDQTDEQCVEPGEEFETACLLETFKDENNQTLQQRKCVLFKKDTRFECADYPRYKTVSCLTCKTDRCNVGGLSNATNTSRGHLN